MDNDYRDLFFDDELPAQSYAPPPPIERPKWTLATVAKPGASPPVLVLDRLASDAVRMLTDATSGTLPATTKREAAERLGRLLKQIVVAAFQSGKPLPAFLPPLLLENCTASLAKLQARKVDVVEEEEVDDLPDDFPAISARPTSWQNRLMQNTHPRDVSLSATSCCPGAGGKGGVADGTGVVEFSSGALAWSPGPCISETFDTVANCERTCVTGNRLM